MMIRMLWAISEVVGTVMETMKSRFAHLHVLLAFEFLKNLLGASLCCIHTGYNLHGRGFEFY